MSKAFVLLGVLAAASGCAPPKRAVSVRPSSAEDLADIRLLERPTLATAEDGIVRIVGPTMTCTGTVFEDDLILTAHHCVVERGAKGEFTQRLVDPGSLRIELGGEQFAWGEVGAQHIVAPPCGESGGTGDIAVLVLKRKLIGLATKTPRLEAPPRLGEDAIPVGFGRCSVAGNTFRKERAGGLVQTMNAGGFRIDAAICPGDSGGPVFARGSKDIIGVVSLAALDHDETTRAPAVMARIDAFRPVFSHAREIANGASPNELPPLECTASAARPGMLGSALPSGKTR